VCCIIVIVYTHQLFVAVCCIIVIVHTYEPSDRICCSVLHRSNRTYTSAHSDRIYISSHQVIVIVRTSTHRDRVLQCVAVCCSVLQCVAVCCSVLQCVAVCCSVVQCNGHQLTSAHSDRTHISS